MLATIVTGGESALVTGFLFTFVLWFGVSAFVVVSRALYDRRARRLLEIAGALTDPAVASLAPLDRYPAIRRILSRLSRRAVYRMVASTELPEWLSEICAAYSLEQWGLARMMRDASAHNRRTKWRRISALFALGHIRAPAAPELLQSAVFDHDPEVSAAAAVVLHRLGDERAARILIAALQYASIPPSRIATHLDQFPISIHRLLRRLLVHPESRSRYWAASLLGRYPDVNGLATELAVLTGDPHPPVRKVALVSLGAVAREAAVHAALQRLTDAVPYVRSAAIRVLAKHGVQEPDVSRREAFASWIAPLMADAEWEVRLAAKESLVLLGPDTWRQVALHLESPDGFACNGAAEVLQNLGVLDAAIEVLGSGPAPSRELERMLTRALQEGGPAMVQAAAERSEPASNAFIENLIANFRLGHAS